MRFIQTFESRYNIENIDKKYYVWKVGSEIGIIKINYIERKNGDINYSMVKPLYTWKDFFTNKKYSDNFGNYYVTLTYWKRQMCGNLLFETDDLTDAITFYDTYFDMKKYNL